MRGTHQKHPEKRTKSEKEIPGYPSAFFFSFFFLKLCCLYTIIPHKPSPQILEFSNFSPTKKFQIIPFDCSGPCSNIGKGDIASLQVPLITPYTEDGSLYKGPGFSSSLPPQNFRHADKIIRISHFWQLASVFSMFITYSDIQCISSDLKVHPSCWPPVIYTIKRYFFLLPMSANPVSFHTLIPTCLPGKIK